MGVNTFIYSINNSETNKLLDDPILRQSLLNEYLKVNKVVSTNYYKFIKDSNNEVTGRYHWIDTILQNLEPCKFYEKWDVSFGSVISFDKFVKEYEDEQIEIKKYTELLKQTHSSEYYLKIKKVLNKRKQRLHKILFGEKEINFVYKTNIAAIYSKVCHIRQILRTHFKKQSDISGADGKLNSFESSKQDLIYSFIFNSMHHEKTKQRNYSNIK